MVNIISEITMYMLSASYVLNTLTDRAAWTLLGVISQRGATIPIICKHTGYHGNQAQASHSKHSSSSPRRASAADNGVRDELSEEGLLCNPYNYQKLNGKVEIAPMHTVG